MRLIQRIRRFFWKRSKTYKNYRDNFHRHDHSRGVWDKELPNLGKKSRENLEITGRASVRMKKGLF